MVYELIGYGTDSRYRDDIRHREYTTSKKKADLFERIPRIQFTDSGHGIVFHAVEHRGKRKPVHRMDYVREQLELLRASEREGGGVSGHTQYGFDSQYGFDWGPVVVERIAHIPGRGYCVSVRGRHDYSGQEIQVLVSEKGRAITAFPIRGAKVRT